MWSKNYEVQVNTDGEDLLIGTRCYTDGSKTSRGTGSGLCIMNDERVVKTRALKLSNHATVFQAELQAIRLACSVIRECEIIEKKVTLLVDSKAALMALENYDTNSELVKLRSGLEPLSIVCLPLCCDQRHDE